MKKIKLAYLGSPYFSASFLEKIILDEELKKIIKIDLVITQPNKPTGRKQIITKTPVKIVAQKFNLKVYDKELEKINFSSFNIALIFAFRKIIPASLLEKPKYGFWCIHPSLLPRYRGPSPIAYPLILGDKKTGVTIIKIDKKIDHGKIISQKQVTIGIGETKEKLIEKLAGEAFPLFKKTINRLINSGLKLKEQEHKKKTLTRLLTKKDGYISLSCLKKSLVNEPLSIDELPKILKENITNKEKIKNSSQLIYHYFKGLYPWPGIWTLIDVGGKRKRLKINEIKYTKNHLEIARLQLENKKKVNFQTFNRAYKIF